MSEEKKQQNTEAMQYDTVLPTAALSGCEIVKCPHYVNKKCNDPIEYVNKYGESVCGRRDDAIAYDDYLEMIEENPPLVAGIDKPAEF